MPLQFDASEAFEESILDIQTLVDYAKDEGGKENEKNRILFLKLAVVSTVTKFQVFIEAILSEFLYEIKNSQKRNGDLHLNFRLNSIRLYLNDKIISKKVENYTNYSLETFNEIKEITVKTLSFCDDDHAISSELLFETKFPLGKNGLEEVTKLFRQIEGKNIFANPPFDINRFNEILARRHSIIHEDSDRQLTEEIVIQYKDYMYSVVEYIDEYLYRCK